MLASNNKIQRHKADIQKRIIDLQNKLKQPIKPIQLFNKDINIDRQLPLRRTYVQKQQYIQPKQVTALRQRQINIKQSRRKYNNNHQQLGQGSGNKYQHHGIYQNKDRDKQRDRERDKDKGREGRGNQYLQNSINKSNRREIQDLVISKTQPINYPRKQANIISQYQHHQHHQPGQTIHNNTINGTNIAKNGDIYDMMAEILNNQKNLQKQIGYLRSQWSREQNLRAHRQNGNKNQTTYGKIKNQDQKINPVISFQQDHTQKPDAFQIRNKKDQHQQKHLSKINYLKENKKNFENKSKKPKVHQAATFGMLKDESEESSQDNGIEVKIHKPPQKSRNSQSVSKNRAALKRAQQAETQQKFYNLIKNQKSKNQRHIVTEQQKTQFWKLVQKRIRQSQTEYNETVHRNNKYEHQHLINTNELQKKLRDDVIGKIYSQCNNCIYK